MTLDSNFRVQVNPYNIEDFRVILRALESSPQANSEQTQKLIKVTKAAIITEAMEGAGGHEDQLDCVECGLPFIRLGNGVSHHIDYNDEVFHERDAEHVPYEEEQ